MAGKRDIQIGTGAAAAVGAAAIGGKLAWDALSGSNGDAARAFRLYRGEPVPEGIRRIARGQLDEAQEQLGGAPKRKLAEGVHSSRKSLKRLRASVRLAREGLGEEVYRRENIAFRDTGRRLSGVRDATVLIDTLDGLVERAGDELPGGLTGRLRERLDEDRKAALATLKGDDDLVAKVTDELESARTRSAGWNFECDGFDALEPGLTRIYRRGRKAMREAADDPTSENFHEWRKRVKDLWHAVQILQPAAPKKMNKLAKRAHELSDFLGDDHDLAELRRYSEAHRDCFDDRAGLRALLAVIDRRRTRLQRRALALGSKLYSQRPKRFVGRIGRGLERHSSRAAA